VTPEKQSTTFQFGALIITEQVVIVPPPVEGEVPEPVILSPLGVALAAFSVCTCAILNLRDPLITMRAVRALRNCGKVMGRRLLRQFHSN
jgi:hypothetical protein